MKTISVTGPVPKTPEAQHIGQLHEPPFIFGSGAESVSTDGVPVVPQPQSAASHPLSATPVCASHNRGAASVPASHKTSPSPVTLDAAPKPAELSQRVLRKRWLARIALQHRSLFCFGGTNTARVLAFELVHHRLFEGLVIVLIIANCIFLALDDPTRDQADQPPIFGQMEIFFTVAFAVEMCLKVFALGFFMHSGSYLRSGWNQLDFIIVTMSFLAFLPWLDNYSAIRTLRVLRPLRSINGIQGLKNIVNGLLGSVKKLVNVLALVAFLLFIFGILGVQLWAGRFRYRCQQAVRADLTPCPVAEVVAEPRRCGQTEAVPDAPLLIENDAEVFCREGAGDVGGIGHLFGRPCDPGYLCLDIGENPNYDFTRFDNFLWAFLAIFQCLTMEGWVDITYIVMDVWSTLGVLYFLLLILLGSFLILNLALAVINDEFDRIREEAETERWQQIQEMQAALLQAESQWADLEEEEEYEEDESDGGVSQWTQEPQDDFGAVVPVVASQPLVHRASVPAQMHVHESVLIARQPERRLSTPQQPDHRQQSRVTICEDPTRSRQASDAIAAHSWGRGTQSVNRVSDASILVHQGRRVYRLWMSLRWVCWHIVAHRFFQPFIILCIVINTVLLATEHHNQPVTLTLLLDNANVVLTAIFTWEMVVKIMASGFRGYAEDKFNVLDGAIVILSLVELSLQGSSIPSFSVFRAFRLLRVFKLLKNFPELRRLISVILHAVSDTGYLNLIILLYLFIAALVGMQFFGGKFNFGDREDGGPRATFDSFGYSFLTVFQVLTRDDWVNVMWDAMLAVSPAAAVYFIVLVICGDFLILNLFLAILIGSFGAHASEENGSDSSSDEEEVAPPEAPPLQERRRTALMDDPIMRQATFLLEATNHAEQARRLTQLSPRDARKSVAMQPSRRNSPAPLQAVTATSTVSPLIVFSGTGAGSFDGLPTAIKSRQSSREGAGMASPAESPRMPRSTLHSCDLHMPLVSPRPSTGRMSSPAPPSVRRTSLGSQPGGHTRRMVRNHSRDHRDQALRTGRAETPTSPYGRAKRNSAASIPGLAATHSFRLRAAQGELELALASAQAAENAGKTPARAQMPQLVQFQRRLSPAAMAMMAAPHFVPSGQQDVLCNMCWEPRFHGGPSATRLELHERICPQIRLRKEREWCLHEILMQIDQWRTVTKPTTETLEFLLGMAWELGLLLETTVEELMEVAEKKVEGDRAVAVCYTLNRQLTTLGRLHADHPFAREQTVALRRSLHAKDSWTSVTELFCVQQLAVDMRLGEELVGRALYTFTSSQLPPVFKTNGGTSLTLFDAENQFRILVYRLVKMPYFDHFILVCILLSSVLMVIENPRHVPDDTTEKVLFVGNWVFTMIFVVEMLCKVIAFGLVFGGDENDPPYLGDSWNVMDGLIVCVSVLALVLQGSNLEILKVFRTFRALRPLRVIARNRGLRMVVITLIQSIGSIGNVALISFIVFLVFGILGVQFFSGKLYHCTDGAIYYRFSCTGHFRSDDGDWQARSWVNRAPQHFDDIRSSLLTLFEISTLELWSQIMWNVIDGVNYDEAGRRNYQLPAAVFFVTFVVVGAFFILNLFVGVVIHHYNQVKTKEDGLYFLTDDQKLWVETQRMMLNFTPVPKMTPPKNPRLLRLYWFAKGESFEMFIGVCILLNILVMSMQHEDPDPDFVTATDWLERTFATVFLLEAVLKIFCFGLSYFSDAWNRFDFMLVVLSIVAVFLDVFQNVGIPVNASFLRVLRVFRVMRIMRLVKAAGDVRILLETVWYSLPSIANIGAFLLLLFFIYAVLGVNLFALVRRGTTPSGLSYHANFESFPNALFLLFRIVTGENWNQVMHDTMVKPPDCNRSLILDDGREVDECGLDWEAPIYYISFLLMAGFVLTNLFVAIILDNFATTMEIEQSNLRMHDLHSFTEIWSEFDPAGCLTIPTGWLPKLLEQLGPPLGISRRTSRIEILTRNRAYCIPEHGGRIHFIETLIPLARHVMNADWNEQMEHRDLRDQEESWRFAFPDINELPVLRVRQRRATTDHYFAASYIAAAERRRYALRQFLQKREAFFGDRFDWSLERLRHAESSEAPAARITALQQQCVRFWIKTYFLNDSIRRELGATPLPEIVQQCTLLRNSGQQADVDPILEKEPQLPQLSTVEKRTALVQKHFRKYRGEDIATPGPVSPLDMRSEHSAGVESPHARGRSPKRLGDKARSKRRLKSMRQHRGGSPGQERAATAAPPPVEPLPARAAEVERSPAARAVQEVHSPADLVITAL
eukprot:TRINITY_DN1051_c1_g1_i1.p1 TRINITY_DN1051_c1_g1~~TRINITY_DN1051_c1_g1_i1.p1  ORF type:complete len:2267 (+),score=738.59 TRINITY_DN1051_c1_g1_i1:119-6919(+)